MRARIGLQSNLEKSACMIVVVDSIARKEAIEFGHVKIKILLTETGTQERSMTSGLFRTLVILHLLQSHCTRGLQYPKQSDGRLTLSRLLIGSDTKHDNAPDEARNK